MCIRAVSTQSYENHLQSAEQTESNYSTTFSHLTKRAVQIKLISIRPKPVAGIDFAVWVE